MKRKTLVILLCIFIFISGMIIVGSVMFKNINNNLEELSQTTIPEIDLSQMEDGVYFGSYSVFPVEVEVKVTISNHMMESIVILKHVNGQGSAAENILVDVIDDQTLQVDAVSGATYSSKVILLAIYDALTN